MENLFSLRFRTRIRHYGYTPTLFRYVCCFNPISTSINDVFTRSSTLDFVPSHKGCLLYRPRRSGSTRPRLWDVRIFLGQDPVLLSLLRPHFILSSCLRLKVVLPVWEMVYGVSRNSGPEPCGRTLNDPRNLPPKAPFFSVRPLPTPSG